MTISLSSRALANTIYALAALDVDRSTGHLTPTALNLLAPDSRVMLKILIKNEFANLAASMFPLVTDMNVDDETAAAAPDDTAGTALPADWLMTMEIPSADLLPPGEAGALRRSIETMLALRCIAAAYAVRGINVRHYLDRAAALLSQVREMLAGPLTSAPVNITPWVV